MIDGTMTVLLLLLGSTRQCVQSFHHTHNLVSKQNGGSSTTTITRNIMRHGESGEARSKSPYNIIHNKNITLRNGVFLFNKECITVIKKSNTCLNQSTSSDSDNEEKKKKMKTRGGDEDDANDLNKFRLLMGNLYGLAGIAHAYDSFLGASQLLRTAGFSSCNELSSMGQVAVCIWCLAGPIAFVLSRQGSGTAADLGLIFYGIVETSLAAISPDSSALVNAGVVQVIVLISWLYSCRQK